MDVGFVFALSVAEMLRQGLPHLLRSGTLRSPFLLRSPRLLRGREFPLHVFLHGCGLSLRGRQRQLLWVLPLSGRQRKLL